MICLDDPGSDSIVPTVLRLILDVCMVICITTFNLFILYAVFRHWKHRILPPSYMNSTILITSLCVADVTVGVSFVYQILPRYLCSVAEYSAHHFVACILHSVVISTGHFSSSLTLVAIAVDRYIAVVHVLRYADIMTARRTLTMVGIAWTTSVLLTTSQFYWNNWTEGEICETVNFQDKYYEITVLPSIFIFTSISLALIYWRIHRVALTVHKMRMAHYLSPKERLRTKSAKTLQLILIFYVVSWVPYIVCTLLRQADVYVSITLIEVFSSETKVTYLANPFIYALNTIPVKQSIMKVVAGIRMTFGRTNSTDSNSSRFTTSVITVCHDSSESEIGNAVGDVKSDKPDT